MNFDALIPILLVNALPVLFAITLHEAANGYAAWRLGDNTGYMLGRVTLNPAKHIDPLGTILMPALLYVLTSGAMMFGYAKPIPVRFDQLRNPKRDLIWVSLAGPASNFVQALIWGVGWHGLMALGISETFFVEMCKAGVRINLLFFAFSLFPIPPLAGGRALVGLLPYKQAAQFVRLEPWGFFIVMGLAVAGVLSAFWLQPLMMLGQIVLGLLLSPLSFFIR